MNVVFSFIHAGKAGRTLGPFAAIRLDAETLRDAKSGAILARHTNHQWEIGGERYFRLDCTSAVKIRFETPSRSSWGSHLSSREYGPYQRFSSVDGIAYVEDRVFAFIDTKVGSWFSYSDGRHWSVMMVSDAAGTRGTKDLLAALAAIAPLLPGVLAIWDTGRLMRLEATGCLGALVKRLAEGRARFERITAVTWETHPEPAARKAELLDEYESGSSSLSITYGAVQGNLARTERVIAQARTARAAARSLRAAARKVRELRLQTIRYFSRTSGRAASSAGVPS